MSDDKKINDGNENSDKLLNYDDYEYEKKIADDERKKRREAEESVTKLKHEREQAKRDEQKRRDKEIAAERVELAKLKAGVIDDDEATIQEEEHKPQEKLHGVEWVKNFWYHDKVWILFAAFLIIVVGYITVTEITRKRPDLTVMMIANNGLDTRQEELENFFEKYTDDLDGNGYVYVQVIEVPLNPNSRDTQSQNTNTSKFLAQLQDSDCIMVITDSNTEKQFKEIMKSDLDKDFPGNKYIDSLGFSMNMRVIADELKFDNMPNDVHLSMRIPIKTVSDSLDDMKKSYAKSFKVFKKIVDDMTKKAEDSNDSGLDTQPIKYDSSSTADSTKESVSSGESSSTGDTTSSD